MHKINMEEQGMTTVVGMVCNDGLVMGSDMKVVGGGVKWSDTKLEKAILGESPLIVGGAGILRHIDDAISWMKLEELDNILSEDYSFNNFLDIVVERSIPAFVRDHRTKYFTNPELQMLVGCIDEVGKPRIAEIYPDGEYAHVEDYSAIGSGSIFGEILLRKLYKPDISLDFAERLIAYIIWEIQGIDNYTGEGMQIMCLSTNRELHEVPALDIEAYKQLPKVLQGGYAGIGDILRDVNLEIIKQAIETLDKAVGQSSEQ